MYKYKSALSHVHFVIGIPEHKLWACASISVIMVSLHSQCSVIGSTLRMKNFKTVIS